VSPARGPPTDWAELVQVHDNRDVNAVRGRYGSVEVTFIGKEDLLRNKRASGRHHDLGDVEELL
jgi:hypothetical protein